jgi:hypothetical protein
LLMYCHLGMFWLYFFLSFPFTQANIVNRLHQKNIDTEKSFEIWI